MIFVISIVLLKITVISSTFLNTNNYKPKVERNNVVNKGVWLKDKFSEDNKKSHVSDFIFKPMSMDTDDLLDNGFYSFTTDVVEDNPFISNYIERAKRSSNAQKKQRLRKTNKCGVNKECLLNNLIKHKTLAESKLMTILKPVSVFNDYPYEVAVLLRNAYSNDNSEKLNQIIPSNEINETHVNVKILVDDETSNNTSSDLKKISLPKRSTSINDQNSNDLNQSDMVGDDDTDAKYVDRNIFNDDRVWQQDSPLPDSDAYKVMPKIERHKIKNINERGLVKVVAMIAKAFKKVMKQHADIKKIHNKLYSIKEDIDNSVNVLFAKFQEFDDQYAYIANISEKIKHIESRLNTRYEYITNKEKALSKSLKEFENQQKKFLAQQKEFYNVQKLMLDQNEKINTKQHYIVQTQSVISQRQYNFARILKKAKEIYMDRKPLNISDQNDSLKKVTLTTTTAPLTTESIKINLFSIPSSTRLVNQDKQILKEIEEKPVDDLIYKFYFNNTFIDNIIKNKILLGFASTNENNQIIRNVKKRDENPDPVKTTILLPVTNTINLNNVENKARERRWIRHSRKLRKKHRGKTEISTNVIDDGKKRNDKTSAPNNIDSSNVKYAKSLGATNIFDTKQEQEENNPFLTMATNFCNQIGQNGNTQVLNWCIEKALRRLQNIGTLMPASKHTTVSKPGEITSTTESTTTDSNWRSVKVTLSPTLNRPIGSSTSATLSTTLASSDAIKTTSGFFPDNDELESNLKQYEIVKDKDGAFYYDSVPATDGDGKSEESDGLSDVMLGFDSNSRIDVDPVTFDLQARRRAAVRRINENILKMYHG